MKFGLLLICPDITGDPGRDFSEYLEQATLAEELGYDSIWVTEHHSRFGVVGSPAVLLAAIAARTSRIRLGSMVAVLPYHSPREVAEQYALVDAISGGRLELGVGRGNLRSELAAHSVDPTTSRSAFWERLSAVRAYWGQGDVRGGTKTFPIPVQHPIPIWVAANGIETAATAFELGLRVATSPAGSGSLDAYLELVTDMHDAIRRSGASADQLEFPLLTMNTYLAPSAEQARAEFGGYAFAMHRLMREADGKPPAAASAEALLAAEVDRGTSLVGDPAFAVRFLEELRRRAGVRHFVAATAQGGLPHDRVLASMELFATQVMDVVRSAEATPSARAV